MWHYQCTNAKDVIQVINLIYPHLGSLKKADADRISIMLAKTRIYQNRSSKETLDTMMEMHRANFSYSEIAEILDRNKDTVSKYISTRIKKEQAQ